MSGLFNEENAHPFLHAKEIDENLSQCHFRKAPSFLSNYQSPCPEMAIMQLR